MISTTVQRNWIFKSLPDTPIFNGVNSPKGKLLNVWFVILGKSRITRKTHVLSNIESAIKKTQGAAHLLSEDHTPEALIHEMAQKSSKFEKTSKQKTHDTPVVWLCDEVAGLFQKLNKKESYMASIEALLSKIYDGRTFSRTTRASGVDLIQNPYLTVFLASTNYLPTLFQEAQVRFGFLNRFVFVKAKRKNRKALRTTPLNPDEIKLKTEIEHYLKALHERKTPVYLEMTPEAKNLYDVYENIVEDKIQKGHLGVREGYMGQLPNLAVRLACLYRISRLSIQEIQDPDLDTLIVEKSDVEKAIDYAGRAWRWFEEVIEIMQTAQTLKLTKVDYAKLAVIDFLEDQKTHHWREIAEYVDKTVGVKQANCYKALDALVAEGKIVKFKAGYYRLKPSRVDKESEK